MNKDERLNYYESKKTNPAVWTSVVAVRHQKSFFCSMETKPPRRTTVVHVSTTPHAHQQISHEYCVAVDFLNLRPILVIDGIFLTDHYSSLEDWSLCWSNEKYAKRHRRLDKKRVS